MNKQTVIQWLKYVAIAAISFFLLLFVLGGLIFGYYAMKAPTLSEKDLVATTSSKIYDNQNNLIADLGAEKRINVSTDQIPTDLVNAIVAIEDHRFFNHRGVEFFSRFLAESWDDALDQGRKSFVEQDEGFSHGAE